jgi:hypothetical protein
MKKELNSSKVYIIVTIIGLIIFLLIGLFI